MSHWRPTAEWKGETVYLIGGGTSVKNEDLSVLKGKRVIVINSSYKAYPDADFVIFADSRWWNVHHEALLKDFKNRIVSVSKHATGPGIKTLKRVKPSPTKSIMTDPSKVVLQKTTLTGAINLCVHLGASKIVLIGIDMGRAPDGTSHHHEPHPWKNKDGNSTWDAQMEQLKLMAKPLVKLGVQVINTSLVSRIDWWPKQSLSDHLAGKKPEKIEMGTPDSREYEMLKRRNFRPYSKGHRLMYDIPISENLIGKKWNILEVGFGIGYGLDQMVKAGVIREYVGCEPNFGSYNYTNGRHSDTNGVTLLHGPFNSDTSKKLGDIQFDVSFCIEVIEHVPEDQHKDFLKLLCELSPVLYFSTPDKRIEASEGVRTCDEWEKMLKEAGFSEVVVNKEQWTYLYACKR